MGRAKKKPSSPYWDWVERKFPQDDTGRTLEPKEANPDMRQEQEPGEPPPELEAAVSVIQRGGLGCLTERQRQMFELVVKRGFAVGRAARVLGISRQAASEHLKAVGRKLREKCEREMRRANQA